MCLRGPVCDIKAIIKYNIIYGIDKGINLSLSQRQLFILNIEEGGI